MYQHIATSRDGAVAHVRLNRPDRLNALGLGPGSNRAELLDALRAADADDTVGAIVLTAEGPAFCAGGDLSAVAPTETSYDEFRFITQLDDFYACIRSIATPLVAGVHGLCLGAGMGLIAQCDLVIAADDARFGLIEGRIGHPGATELVPIIGPQWAKFLILTGELIGADVAERLGLVLTVVPAIDLAERVTDLARRIAAVPYESAVLNVAAIDAVTEAAGQQAGRRAGRAVDVTTKTAAKDATAPDGRSFEEIFRTEGAAGLKRARDAQFTGSWLRGTGR